jgi:hypothetical protein
MLCLGHFLSSLSKSALIAKSKKLISFIHEYMFVKGGTSGVRYQEISFHSEFIMHFDS